MSHAHTLCPTRVFVTFPSDDLSGPTNGSECYGKQVSVQPARFTLASLVIGRRNAAAPRFGGRRAAQHPVPRRARAAPLSKLGPVRYPLPETRTPYTMDAFAALGSADDRPLPPPPRAGGMMMQPPLEMPAMPDPMGGSAAISTAMHAWTPATFSPPLLGLRAERAVDYVGEKASMFSFFTNFYTIILRKRGSALPKIMIEIFLATCLGVVAYLLTEDGLCDAKKCKGFFLPPSTSREKGHAMIGVLLAFLVVFRSQIAWGMYMEGRNAVGKVVAMSRCLALELLASLAHACVEEGISEKTTGLGVSPSGRPRVVVRRGGVTLPTIRRTKKSDIELAVLALECVRLLKLHVLLRRPLLSSRCSRWHRVPRPRRVDGATRHAIDAMPHAVLDADRACALRRRRGGVDCGR